MSPPDMQFHPWLVGMRAALELMLTDLQQLNKRSVHRAMEIMGMRAALRAGTEIQALGFHQKSAREYFKTLMGGPLTRALDARDAAFGDYRTAETKEEGGS
jgi:enoyl-CoA hydratase